MLLLLLSLLGADPAPRADTPRADLLLVTGAAGTEQYGAEFAEWSASWERAAERGRAALHRASDRDELAAALKQQLAEESRPLWIVMIGHGTFDGRDARFNLRGPDITDEWLHEQLADCRRPLAVLACFSSSAPFLNRLSGPNRVVVTATKSGFEQNYSRFGGFLALAAADGEADLDKDGQTSLLEAFLLASKRTEQFYEAENRLATEHALLDDNGDQKGTAAGFFRGIHPAKPPKQGALDGLLANQIHLIPSAREQHASAEFIAARDDLERQISQLRKRRRQLGDDAYLRQLEPLLVRLARLYAELDAVQ